eukprot:TRINITY_DN10388_c0_g3_i1.p2 TRINITY_DN10388_c0_g3~~TRINITY_DN10388_c0_g3_i1.p2  ORF type:complete len:123 (+),score=3.28 TRINITY_DN10388_c0_g3_i1:41-409(+)
MYVYVCVCTCITMCIYDMYIYISTHIHTFMCVYVRKYVGCHKTCGWDESILFVPLTPELSISMVDPATVSTDAEAFPKEANEFKAMVDPVANVTAVQSGATNREENTHSANKDFVMSRVREI